MKLLARAGGAEDERLANVGRGEEVVVVGGLPGRLERGEGRPGKVFADPVPARQAVEGGCKAGGDAGTCGDGADLALARNGGRDRQSPAGNTAVRAVSR